MNYSTCIVLLSLTKIFAVEDNSPIDGLSAEHHTKLLKYLYYNHNNILSNFENKNYDIKYILNIDDKDYINNESIEENAYFINELKDWQNVENILNKIQNTYQNTIIIFTNSIGYSPNDIQQIINLLNKEDDVTIIGKANDKVALVAFNKFDSDILLNIPTDIIPYDIFLQNVNLRNNLVYVLENFSIFESLADFRDLYNLLSKKESKEFCNDDIHQKFTNIFIEYKDLLV